MTPCNYIIPIQGLKNKKSQKNVDHKMSWISLRDNLFWCFSHFWSQIFKLQPFEEVFQLWHSFASYNLKVGRILEIREFRFINFLLLKKPGLHLNKISFFHHVCCQTGSVFEYLQGATNINSLIIILSDSLSVSERGEWGPTHWLDQGHLTLV